MPRKATNRAEKNRRRLKRKTTLSPAQLKQQADAALIRDFPRIRFTNFSSSEDLVERVKEIVDQLKISQDIPKKIREDLRLYSIGKLCSSPVLRADSIEMVFGELIYQELRKSFNTRFHWYDDVQVVPDSQNRHSFEIRFRSLEKINSTTYVAPHRPTVIIDDQVFLVAYRKHVLERLADRLVKNRESYIDWGVVAAIPYKTKYFEIINTPKQCLISLWDRCDPSIKIGETYQKLAGAAAMSGLFRGVPLLVKGGDLVYYRLGYCPIKFDKENDVAILTTLLLPGMDNTPEFYEFQRSPRSNKEIREFSRRVEKSAKKFHDDPKYTSTIEELHSLVPQVKVIQETVFEGEGIPKKKLMSEFEQVRFRFDVTD